MNDESWDALALWAKKDRKGAMEIWRRAKVPLQRQAPARLLPELAEDMLAAGVLDLDALVGDGGFGVSSLRWADSEAVLAAFEEERPGILDGLFESGAFSAEIPVDTHGEAWRATIAHVPEDLRRGLLEAARLEGRRTEEERAERAALVEAYLADASREPAART